MQEMSVPKSVSTFHKSKTSALSEPWGKFKIAISKKERLLINKLYDGKQINYSNQYYTNQNLSTESYDKSINQVVLRILQELNIKSVIEIGCGQGGLVRFLQKRFRIVGYDPILSKNTKNLKKDFYPTATNSPAADFYILQCVLPHIDQPKSYIESIFAVNKESYIYIEFPSLDFILKNRLWYQFSYEHINYFTFSYFQRYFNLVEKGTYRGGEWSYVVLKHKEFSRKFNSISLYLYYIWAKLVISNAKKDLIKINELTNNKTLFIFGAGGKGAMLAAHIYKNAQNVQLYMVDNDVKKHNLLLGSTAIKVISVQKALKLVNKDTFVIAANPNHKSLVSNIFGSLSTIIDFQSI